MTADDRYRTFWLRFFAGLIDGIVFIPVGLLDAGIHYVVDDPAILVPWSVLVAFSFLAYSIGLHARSGQTVGKRAMGIRVLSLDETPLTLRQAIRRDSPLLVLTAVQVLLSVGRLIRGGPVLFADSSTLSTVEWLLASANLIWFCLELITTLTNRKRRALHDFIAGSVVVRTSSPA